MDVRRFWHSLLERLHLLHTVIDIGDDLRIMEMLVVGPWRRVIHTHSESFYDEQRLSFSVERFLQKYATYNVKRVHLTVSRISIISQFLPLPDIPKDKLEQVVEWQLTKLLHLSAQDVVVGYQVLSRTHFSGTPGWNVVASVMKKSELRQYHEIIDDAHLLPYRITHIAFLNVLPYLPRRSEQAEGLVIWRAHYMIMAIVEKGDIVQYQMQMLPENRHMPTELKSLAQFFSEYIKLGGGYLVKVHIRALSEEEEAFFVEGVLDSINILAEGVTGSSFFRRSKVSPNFWDMYALFSSSAKQYQISFPLPAKGEHRVFWDGLAQWGLVLCSLVIIMGAVLSPWMLYTRHQYAIYQRAEEILVSGRGEIDEVLQQRVEEVRRLQHLQRYQEEKRHYERLIAEAEHVGIESSNLKMVIVAIAQALPQDVRVTRLSLQTGKGEITGESRSSEGLQSFVKALLQSPYLRRLVIAEARRGDAGPVIFFRILFEVNL